MSRQASILIVDDEPLLAEITAEWLRRNGFSALTAENGSQAWNILQETKVDIVISDVRMPIMDGVALLQKIISSGSEAPHVILVTGHADFDRRTAYDLGVETVLDKPVHRVQLIDAMHRMLNTKEQAWSTVPPPCESATLRNSFKSLADAISRGFIALGRGGLCIASSSYLPGVCVPLNLRFAADRQSIVGQGVVRWSDCDQQRMGVEIAYLEEDCREWVIRLLAGVALPSFIPRETSVTR